MNTPPPLNLAAPDEPSRRRRFLGVFRRLGLFLGLMVLSVGVLRASAPEPEVAVRLSAQTLLRKHVGWIDAQAQAWCAAERCDQARLQVSVDHVTRGALRARTESALDQALSRLKVPVGRGSVASPKALVEVVPLGGEVMLRMAFVPPEGGGGEPSRVRFVQKVPHWSSVLPPLLAMWLAVCFGRLLLGLGAAVWVGAALSVGWAPHTATWKALSGYVWGSVSEGFNLYVIGFTLSLVGMVHVILKMGGMAGLLERVKRFARSARATRVTTALMGFVLFFDDYANTIVVGSTMRPLTDARRISREKLAYLVDATSAPVAGLAVVSTWIGFEVGLFEELRVQLGMAQSGYAIFFEILPLRFYCIFTLCFVLLCAWSGRDFGPMRRAEERAWVEGRLWREGSSTLSGGGGGGGRFEAAAGAPLRARNALVPIGSVLVGVVVGMWWSGWRGAGGEQIASVGGVVFGGGAFVGPWGLALGEAFVGGVEGWRAVFSGADNAKVLFWSALVGSGVAVGLAVGQGILSFGQAVRSWVGAMGGMWMAIGLLVLAWSIRSVCVELGTGEHLIALLDGRVGVGMLPLLTFGLAAAVALATGTSWGTMGILLPTMIPLAYGMTRGAEHGELVLLLCFGAVLDGAIFGDHCSPISDTTVMSSIASECDHLDHVRTQIPYAVTTMGVAGGMGYVGVAWGLPVWAALGGGVLVLVALLFGVGRGRAGGRDHFEED